MVRTVVRLHTAILGFAALALLIAPGSILAAFGVEAPSFPVLALTRVLAGFLIVLAAAILPVPDLPVSARRRALGLIAIAYAILVALCISQQVAIWSSIAGLLLSAELTLHAAAFAWLAMAERSPSRLAADAL